uniref:Integrase core domain containing protein n=1 Tax=Solanum tuberosum TaxID=4113 RepID=M1DIC2_SOLTU
MAMRAKKHQKSHPVPMLITELCRRACVPRDVKTDGEMATTFSTDIGHIEAEYQKDEAERRRICYWYYCLHASDHLGHAALDGAPIQFWCCAYPQLEAAFPRMIERALTAAVTPLRAFIDALNARIEIPDDTSTDIPICYDVPPTTIVDHIRDDDATLESEDETNEEQLGVQEETIF